MIEKELMKVENRMKNIESQLVEAASFRKRLDQRIDNLKEIYVSTRHYEDDKKRFALQMDFSTLKKKVACKANEDDLKRQIKRHELMIEDLKIDGKKTYATKEELFMDMRSVDIRVKKGFMTIEEFRKVRNQQDNKLQEIDAEVYTCKARLNTHNQDLNYLKDEIQLKANRKETKIIEMNLKKTALYDDYKKLYELVVPPVAEMQRLGNEISEDWEKHREVIRNFDKVILNKAQKQDIIDVKVLQKNYLKKSKFEEAEKNIEN